MSDSTARRAASWPSLLTSLRHATRLAFAARSRSHATGRTGLATTAVVLNILGLALGLPAQLMMLFVMSRS